MEVVQWWEWTVAWFDPIYVYVHVYAGEKK
jgi:hypothetical protein